MSKGAFVMLIPIVYSNGRQDLVKPFVLDRLIEDRKISSFRRAAGWVVIGRDPIRNSSHKVFSIPERRQAEVALID